MIYLIILIIIVLIGGFAFFYAVTYNELQHFKTRIELSENSIDENLRKKYDLICELNIEIKKECKDKDYLKEFIELNEKKLTNYDTDRKLTEAIFLIKELQNDHKKLNNTNFNKCLKEVKKIDETLSASKNFYNKHTSSLNSLIRKFPNSLVAKIHKFKIKPFFDHKNMQDAVIDDFKL